MIVPSLSFEEIIKHFERDFTFIQHKTLAFRDGVLREFLNTQLSRCTRSVEMIAPSRNRWLVFYSMTRSPRHIDAFHLLYYDDDSGIHTIKKLIVGAGANADVAYARQDGHFYHRYNTRMSLGITKPIEVIKYFHKHNGEFLEKFEREENEDGSVNVFATVREGIILGVQYRKEKYSLYKTFVTDAMLHKEQKDLAAFMRDPAIQEEIWKKGQ